MIDRGKYQQNTPNPIQKRVDPSSLRFERDEAEDTMTFLIVLILASLFFQVEVRWFFLSKQWPLEEYHRRDVQRKTCDKMTLSK